MASSVEVEAASQDGMGGSVREWHVVRVFADSADVTPMPTVFSKLYRRTIPMIPITYPYSIVQFSDSASWGQMQIGKGGSRMTSAEENATI